MKKYFIFIPIVIALLVAIIITIAMHVDTFEIMTIPRSYSFASTYSDDDEMDVYVYVSSKNSFVVKKDRVSNCFIKSKITSDELKIDLLDITDCDEKIKVYGHYFYLFRFRFDIAFKTTSEYELAINEALLTLEYDRKEISLRLGSFYYYKMPYYGDETNTLIVTSLKPVLGYIGENRTISGIEIGLRNNSSSDITITNIKLLDPNVYPSLSEVKIITTQTSGIETISSILGYNYALKDTDKGEGEISLLIEKKGTVNIVVPIKYLDDYPINTLGFIISYQVKGQDEIIKYYYDDYVFFNSMKETYDESMITISTYENN